VLGFVSIAIGVVFGLITSIIFKNFSFLRVSAITETFLLIALSMIAYFYSEMCVIAGIKMSGIISLLTAGIVQSHYTYHNLSEQGKVTSTLTVTFLGHCAEAGVYSYIAIALYANIPGWWSVEFIILETILVIAGRFAAIFITYYLFTICFKSRTLNPKELLFIAWGGTIRGAIAFALVLKIPTVGTHSCTTKEEYCFTKQNYELMVSTTLIICYITTLVFASFL
jgi:NhaP-type Na+/H+ or K+/H+ antiporter